MSQENIFDNNEKPILEEDKKIDNMINTSQLSLANAKVLWSWLSKEKLILMNQQIFDFLFTIIFINKKVYTNNKLDYSKCKRTLIYFMNVNRINYQMQYYKHMESYFQILIKKNEILTPYQLNKNKWLFMTFDQLKLCVMQGNPRVYLFLESTV